MITTNDYQLLSIFKYNGNGPTKTPQDVLKEYQSRLQGYSTQRTDLHPLLTFKNGKQTNEYPLFFVQINSITEGEAVIRKNSEKILTVSSKLPGVAKMSFTNSLLISEIYSTNKIEGVKTNKQEIGTVIGDINSKRQNIPPKRLSSTVRLYMDNLQGKILKIHELKDIRNIYDILLKNEIKEQDLPDGQIFRNSKVFIGTKDGTKIVHIPPSKEYEIQEMLVPLISFMNSHNLLSATKALITHFMFENIHPFNDGNGRTGRYLLSSYLSNKYDVFTGLSISTAIHKNSSTYYRIFKDADNANNMADITIFLSKMMEIIISEQLDVLAKLQGLLDKYEIAFKKIKDTVIDPSKDHVLFNVAIIFAQSKLFSLNESTGIKDSELVSFLSKESPREFKKTAIKNAIATLEKSGILELVKQRPKQHIILDKYIHS